MPHIRIPKGEVLRQQFERYYPPFPRRQAHSLKALEFEYRPGDGRLIVTNVQLHDLVAGPHAGVRDFDFDARWLTRGNCRRQDPRRRNGECPPKAGRPSGRSASAVKS